MHIHNQQSNSQQSASRGRTLSTLGHFSVGLLQIWLTVNKLIALDTANKGDATAAVVVAVVSFSPFCLNKTI